MFTLQYFLCPCTLCSKWSSIGIYSTQYTIISLPPLLYTWQIGQHPILGLNCSCLNREAFLQCTLHIIELAVSSVDMVGGAIFAQNLDDVGLYVWNASRNRISHLLKCEYVLASFPGFRGKSRRRAWYILTDGTAYFKYYHRRIQVPVTGDYERI